MREAAREMEQAALELLRQALRAARALGEDHERVALLQGRCQRRERKEGGDPLEPLEDALQRGDSIILFPEGTRGEGDEPQAFKSGLYTLATRFPEVVLVPAWIDNIQRVMPKGEVVPVPILCSVTFGAPVRVEPGEERRAFLDRARAAVIALRDI